MSDKSEAQFALFETFDKRLSAIEGRFAHVEGHLAESATATDETAKNTERLTELYLSMDSRLDSIEKLLGNYVEATKARTQQARKAEERAESLISEVRKRCPEAVSGT